VKKENNKNSDASLPEELRRVNTLHEQYKSQIYNEILKRNSKNGIDKNKFEKFILEIGRTIGIYTLSKPNATFPGPTDQRKRLEDILKTFNVPARRSPIYYLNEIVSSEGQFIISLYDNPFIYGDEKRIEEWSQEVDKAAEEAKAALEHIANLIDIIQNELSIHKKRRRGRRVNRPQFLDRAVDEVYRSCFGKIGNKALMTEIKLIVREIVGEPSTDIRKSVK
jgi:hypothetical protein